MVNSFLVGFPSAERLSSFILSTLLTPEIFSSLLINLFLFTESGLPLSILFEVLIHLSKSSVFP